jgi:hypothetical protein
VRPERTTEGPANGTPPFPDHADQENVTRHDRMIPGLAAQGMNPGDFGVTLGPGWNQGNVPALRQHQQHPLVGQEQ